MRLLDPDGVVVDVVVDVDVVGAELDVVVPARVSTEVLWTLLMTVTLVLLTL
ncbi:MAG: hypothetical protein ACLGI2_14565 [Acidimicrobiia bacterium]